MRSGLDDYVVMCGCCHKELNMDVAKYNQCPRCGELFHCDGCMKSHKCGVQTNETLDTEASEQLREERDAIAAYNRGRALKAMGIGALIGWGLTNWFLDGL